MRNRSHGRRGPQIADPTALRGPGAALRDRTPWTTWSAGSRPYALRDPVPSGQRQPTRHDLTAVGARRAVPLRGSPAIRAEIEIDAFIAMPNHQRAIICIKAPYLAGAPADPGHDATCPGTSPWHVGAHGRAPLPKVGSTPCPPPRSLGSFVAGFKSGALRPHGRRAALRDRKPWTTWSANSGPYGAAEPHRATRNHGRRGPLEADPMRSGPCSQRGAATNQARTYTRATGTARGALC